VALKINAKMGGVNVKLVGPYDQVREEGWELGRQKGYGCNK
jgi:hypothetical protein